MFMIHFLGLEKVIQLVPQSTVYLIIVVNNQI